MAVDPGPLPMRVMRAWSTIRVALDRRFSSLDDSWEWAGWGRGPRKEHKHKDGGEGVGVNVGRGGRVHGVVGEGAYTTERGTQHEQSN